MKFDKFSDQREANACALFNLTRCIHLKETCENFIQFIFRNPNPSICYLNDQNSCIVSTVNCAFIRFNR